MMQVSQTEERDRLEPSLFMFGSLNSFHGNETASPEIHSASLVP